MQHLNTICRQPFWSASFSSHFICLSNPSNGTLPFLEPLAFCSAGLNSPPNRTRSEDGVLMALVELALVLIYLCVLLIKTCNVDPFDPILSAQVCEMYGFGSSPKGKQCG